LKGLQVPKFATVVIDSGGELSRLYFSKARGKHASDMENLRQLNDYTPTTERLNILFRRLQDLRDTGTEIVIICHEQVDKIFAKGGEIGAKNAPPPEPMAVRGMPDLPGKVAPEELMRKSDNLLRMRVVNSKLMWVTKQEPLGGSASDSPWIAGCRFDSLKLAPAGYLPASYIEIKNLASKCPEANFVPPYIWMIYGAPKIGKTRLVCNTFPKPLRLYDLDRGRKVLGSDEVIKAAGIIPVQFNSEECDDYTRFLADLATCF
jgi:hypothetical protein